MHEGRIITELSRGQLVWTRRDLPSAPLSYRGHLRFLQGAPLRDLFLPLLLLRGTPCPIWRVPFELHDVVLAEIHEAPEDMTMGQIALELTKIVLAPARVP